MRINFDTPMKTNELRPYLDDIRVWHGFVRFLGLPTLQDNPDTPIDNLFVVPMVSKEAISADIDPKDWPQGQDVFTMLKDYRRLVILGDPGGGKTTLLNWLAWLLVSGRVGGIPEWLNNVFPIPLVLRELDLREVSSFESLIDAFLKRPVAEKLQGKKSLLITGLQAGKVMVLVDGFDEVPKSLQDKIRAALWDGFDKYEKCLFVVTSRLVGYDDCPLHHQTVNKTKKIIVKLKGEGQDHEVIINEDGYEEVTKTRASLAYVMPFDNQRIRNFAHNWYQLRTFRQKADGDANEFVQAIFANATTLRLARTPQLLTLMALVFRVRAHLPDGRAFLYDLISEAYLESIDRSRKLAQDPYPWKEKQRWLARVGFEMQLLRTSDSKKPGGSSGKELLVSRKRVLKWIQQAMEHSGYDKNESFAEEYLNWIARRSGLLLPRGENLFSFLHLSFQEYFAALYLEEHLSDPDWVIAQRDQNLYPEGDERVTANILRTWAGDTRWQETLVFCFERFAHAPREARRLAEWIYGKEFSIVLENTTFQIDTTRDEAKAELLSRIVVDPHSGLAPKEKERAFTTLCNYFVSPSKHNKYNRIESYVNYDLSETVAMNMLFVDNVIEQKFWEIAEKLNIVTASITEQADSFISRIQNWPNIIDLTLGNYYKSDLSRIAALKKLESLFVTGYELNDITALSSSVNLQALYIFLTSVYDISPLSELYSLTRLFLVNNKISDISPLSKLNQLQNLDLSNNTIEDISPISSLTNLTNLSIGNNNIVDFTPILSLKLLNTLNIRNSKLINLDLIVDLPLLSKLNIRNSTSFDVYKLSEMSNLVELDVSYTPITNLDPISKLTKLRELKLKGTEICDITPLASLLNLKSLDITDTKVKDVAPLEHLKDLKITGFKPRKAMRHKMSS